MNQGKPRLASVDALRGCTVAAMLLVNDPGDWGHVYAPLEHAEWNGCTPTDLVFPFFLFIVGISTVLSFEPRLAAGRSRNELMRGAGWRALRILVLGLAINALAAWLMPGVHMRLPGVLQRIALCYAVGAVVALYVRPFWQWLLGAVLLVGYASLLWAGGSLEPWFNIASRLDTAVFGHLTYLWNDALGRGHDPEGLLSTVPAIVTTLLGLAAGRALRRGGAGRLLPAALAGLALGMAWSAWLPFNKNLWTPSFVLWTAGWASMATWIAHMLVDRQGLRAIGRRFGINAITAFAGSEVMQILMAGFGWQKLLYAHLFADPITPIAGPYIASLAWAVAFVLFWWVVVWVLDRRAVYLKL